MPIIPLPIEHSRPNDQETDKRISRYLKSGLIGAVSGAYSHHIPLMSEQLAMSGELGYSPHNHLNPENYSPKFIGQIGSPLSSALQPNLRRAAIGGAIGIGTQGAIDLYRSLKSKKQEEGEVPDVPNKKNLAIEGLKGGVKGLGIGLAANYAIGKAYADGLVGKERNNNQRLILKNMYRSPLYGFIAGSVYGAAKAKKDNDDKIAYDYRPMIAGVVGGSLAGDYLQKKIRMNQAAIQAPSGEYRTPFGGYIAGGLAGVYAGRAIKKYTGMDSTEMPDIIGTTTGAAIGGAIHSKLLSQGKGRDFAGNRWENLDGVTDPDLAKSIISDEKRHLGRALGIYNSGDVIRAGMNIGRRIRYKFPIRPETIEDPAEIKYYDSVFNKYRPKDT